jgi:hypothetical protein
LQKSRGGGGRWSDPIKFFGFLQNPGRSLSPGPQSKREKLLRISSVEHGGARDSDHGLGGGSISCTYKKLRSYRIAYHITTQRLSNDTVCRILQFRLLPGYESFFYPTGSACRTETPFRLEFPACLLLTRFPRLKSYLKP